MHGLARADPGQQASQPGRGGERVLGPGRGGGALGGGQVADDCVALRRGGRTGVQGVCRRFTGDAGVGAVRTGGRRRTRLPAPADVASAREMGRVLVGAAGASAVCQGRAARRRRPRSDPSSSCSAAAARRSTGSSGSGVGRGAAARGRGFRHRRPCTRRARPPAGRLPARPSRSARAPGDGRAVVGHGAARSSGSRRRCAPASHEPGREPAAVGTSAPQGLGIAVDARATTTADSGRRVRPWARPRPARSSSACSPRSSPPPASTSRTLEVTPAGKRRVVRVVVDKDGGVSLDDVAAVSPAVSATLDEPPLRRAGRRAVRARGDLPRRGPAAHRAAALAPRRRAGWCARPRADGGEVSRPGARGVRRRRSSSTSTASRDASRCAELGRGRVQVEFNRPGGGRTRTSPPRSPPRRRRARRRRAGGGVAVDIDMAALRGLEREKEISFDLLVEAIESALLIAYQRTEGHAAAGPRRARPQAPATSPCGRAETDDGRRRPARVRRHPHAASAASRPRRPSRSSCSACATPRTR